MQLKLIDWYRNSSTDLQREVTEYWEILLTGSPFSYTLVWIAFLCLICWIEVVRNVTFSINQTCSTLNSVQMSLVTPSEWSWPIVMSVSVCLSVCSHIYLGNNVSKLFCGCYLWRDSFLFSQHCKTLRFNFFCGRRHCLYIMARSS